ncbi:uncharacterized protein DUF397 [Tamaricihabitans halophyticus]|uniref:Uncharacterized protein DUF397 n=1 Tax=Tamaricihabitans halophyticus TaxID=1262583 RepID=A0A4R2QA97_9PSEU|nr:DUF397 domain-containing protein [Tamaricihabitans halophyticus]TCP45114.1 uncharacterized protein DUF397 [Tamaricihabitans halophyticus]
MEVRNSLRWRKSSYSGGGNNCVEVASYPASVAIRDTKNRTAGRLTVSLSAWSAFVAGL